MTEARIALVGHGLVGKRHVAALAAAKGVRLAAIVEPAGAVADVPVFPSLDALFAATEIDGVILATPTPLHVDGALACVAARIPTLIEKPIATRAEDASRLIAEAAAARVPLLVGHHRRHFATAAAAKAAIEHGAIGDIRAVQATCWLYKPDPYFAEAPWRTKRGAGPISVNLVHDIDLLRYFCGEVVEVTARAAPSRRGFENEDLAAAILTFDSGAIATISVSDSTVGPWSWEHTARENPVYSATDESCYLIGGTTGALSIPDMRLWRFEGAPDWWAPLGAETLKVDARDALTAQAEHFGQVIRGEAPPLVSGEEGLRSLVVVEAVQAAAETGTSITIPRLDG